MMDISGIAGSNSGIQLLINTSVDPFKGSGEILHTLDLNYGEQWYAFKFLIRKLYFLIGFSSFFEQFVHIIEIHKFIKHIF